MKTAVWVILAALNLLLFILMGADKARARRKKRRISERTLMIHAVLFGAVGGCAGMWVFRHKTLHNKFRFGFPSLAVAQVVLSAWLLHSLA